MRLNKFLAGAGVDSRRKCDEIIAKGRVRINAKVVKKMGVQVDPIRDIITVDNRPVRLKQDFVYFMLNKPTGVVTTVRDPKGRKTVMDCLPQISAKRIWPIGRLDYNTSGLLLMTNDGDTAQKLIHPKFEIDKVYLATIDGKLTQEQINIFLTGVDIGDYVTRPSQITEYKQQKNQTTYKVIIHEGKNRQIRRMFSAVGSEVIQLKRIAIGAIKLGDLPVGQCRELTEKEVNYLLSK